MFEKLLESVLKKYAEKFLDGIDSKNLSIGIFSGDVVIENVQIKQEILNTLELPIQLKFSHIGKLQLKVPFTSIGSSPVEVFLDGLYLVIVPKHPNQWEFKDYKGLEVKKELIELYVQSCISKIVSASKQKTEGKDAGYMKNLQLKIIDNIQLTIKSIHIRFENYLTGSSQQQYSMGISLDQFDAFTTDADGNKKYIDRTKEEFKDQPMRKQLILSNLGIYWNSKENCILSSENNKKEIIQHMEGMIRRQNQTTTRIPCDYLISISSLTKLIQSEKGNFSRPEVEITIDLNRIDFSLENQQLQQIILLAEFFNQYNMRLKYKKKTKKILNSEQIQNYQNQFTELYTKILEDKNQSYSVLTLIQNNQIEECILSLEIDTLLELVKNVCLQIEKQKKLKQLIEQKQKEQQGYFGGWFGGGSNKKGENLITEEEKQQLDSFFNENISSQIDYSNLMRPQNYVWFILEFNLKGCSIYLNKVQLQREKEGIKFNYDNLLGSVKMRGEKNIQVQLSITTMNLELIDDLIQDQSQQQYQDRKKIVNFLRPNEYVVQDQNFVQFMFEASPLEETHINNSISLKIGSARVEYNPAFVYRIVKFFDVKLNDEELKQATWEKVEEQLEYQINNINQAIVSPSILKLDIYLQTPVIILPYKNDGSQINECWVINLGNLSVKTNQGVLKPNLSIQEQYFDKYDINLDNIKFEVFKFILQQKYFPSLLYFNQTQDNIIKSQIPPIWADKIIPGHYILVQNFSISVSVTIIKGKFQSQYQGKPNIFVQGKLDIISLNLTPSMYKRLLSIHQCFVLQKNDTKNQTINVEDLQLERIELMKNANKVGQIYIRGNQIKTWQKKYGILSKGYLYIFQNVKDIKAETYYWVKNSQVNSVSEEQTGFKNSFNVMNKYTDIYLACEKEENSKQWIQILQQQVSNVQKVVSISTSAENTNLKKSIDPNKKKFQIQFSINNINLSLFEENCVTKFLQFETSQISLDYDKNNFGFDCKLSLGDIYITDYIQKYKDPALKDFISSEGTDNINKLILIQIKQRQKTHPEYKNIDIDIELFFGVLLINFKTTSFIKVLQFFKVNKSTQKDITNRNESVKIAQNNIDQSNIEDLELGKNNTNPVLYASKNDRIFVQAKVFIQQIKIVFVNRNPPNLAIAEIQILETGFTFQQKIDEKLIDGKLGNFQLFDLTNYPNTIHKEEDWEKCNRTELIGVLKEKGTSLLEIKFKMLQDGSPKIKEDNVTIFVLLKISKIVANFLMQPTMRLIDYSLTQIVGPFTNPKQLQLQEMTEQTDPIEQLKLLGINAVLTNIINPKCMLLDILLEDPTVIIKPNPNSSEYLVIDVGKAILKNVRRHNNSRIVNNKRQDIAKTFSDAQQIQLSNIGIKLIKKLKEIQLCKSFNFNVEVEMPIFVNEYQFIFGNDLILDKSIIIKCYATPLVILMTNEDYNFIMRIIFHNIIYDDGCDRFMIYQYEKRQVPVPLPVQIIKEQLINSKEQFVPTQRGIFLSLDMENISIFASEGEEYIPFARVTLDKIRILFIKKSPNSDLKIFCEELDGSYFTKQVDSNIYLEKGLLRKFGVNNEYNENQMKDSFFLFDSIQQKYLNDMENVFQFINFDEKSQTHQFIFDIEMKSSGDKDINIKVSHFTVHAEIGPLLKLAGLAVMNETVTPPQPVYNASQKNLEQIKIDTLEQNQQQAGNNMIINIIISNIIICTPAAETQNILAIRGEFFIQLNFFRILNIQEIVEKIKINKLSFEQAHELNKKSLFSITLQQLEIFITNDFELQNQKEFKFMKKRELLQPLDVTLKIRQNLVVNKELDNFYLKKEIKLIILQTIMKVSAQDLLLIQQTSNYLLEQIPQKYQNQQEQSPEKLQEEKMQTKSIELQELCLDPSKQYQSFIDVNVDGFQIIIINDIGKIFTPVLEFNLWEFQLKIVQNPINSKITTTITFRSQYFNSRTSDWSPIIELVRFHIDIIQNQVGNVQSLICVKLEPISDQETEKLNINVSTQFLSALMQMIYLMQEQKEKTIKKSKTKNSSKQSVSNGTDLKVSPYTIKNETGYPIIVKGKNNQNIQIDSNSQIIYEVEKNQESLLRKGNLQQSKNLIRFNLSCLNFNFQDVENVDLERMRCKKIFLQGINYISSQVYLDMKTNGKILNISSSLLFCNKTMERLAFEFVSPKIKFDKVVAKQNKNVPVPFECLLEGTLTLSFEDEENQKIQSKIPTKVVIKLKNIQLTTFQEISIGDQFLILRLIQDQSNEFKQIIYIEPPYRFINCLPKCMHIQLLPDNKKANKIEELSQKQIYEYYDQSQSRKIYIKILLHGYIWSEETILFDPQKKGQRIIIKDSSNNNVFIPYYQHLSGDKNGCREYFFYCKAYIINDSPYNLVYYSRNAEKKSKPKIIGGQYDSNDQTITSSITILGEEVNNILIFAEKNSPDNLSLGISTTGVGTNQVDISINNQLLTFGVQVQLQQTEKQHGLLTQIIKISPRFILVNLSDRDIVIKQASVESPKMINKLLLRKNERQPLFWFDNKKEKKICINYFEVDEQNNNQEDLCPDDHSLWSWSFPIDVSNIGVQNFLIRSKANLKNYKFFRTDTRQGESNIFVVFENLSEAQEPYKIINNIGGLAELYLPQILCTLKNSEFTYFSWDNPSDQNKLLKITIKSNDYKDFSLDINPDIINFKQKLKLKNQKKDDDRIYLKFVITIEGFTKIVTFQMSDKKEKIVKRKDKQDVIKDAKKQIEEEKVEVDSRVSQNFGDTIIRQISLHIECIGLSIIENHTDNKGNNRELLFIKLENVELAMQEKKKSKTIQLRVKYLNIDNNSSQFVSYPVTLTPLKKESYKDKEKEKYFLNILVVQNLNAKNITLYDNLVFEIDPMSLKMDWSLINSLINYKRGLFECLDIIQNKEEQELEVFLKYLRDIQNQKFRYLDDQLPDVQAPTYIDQIIISPIKIFLTFKSEKSMTEGSNIMLLDTLFSIIGVTVLNVDNSPLKLNGIKLHNCLDTLPGITNKLMTHYKDQALTEGLKIVGSLNFIGNPIGLFNNISTGVIDLFDKPIEGFAKGPLEGGMGIMKGATSLVTNTISGAFNTVSTMTGAVGSGIATLCFDDKYLEEREKMSNKKPKHLVDGVAQGLESFGIGLFEGISGIFVKPFEGAKEKDGVLGFFKGVGQGLTGVVVKPLTGIFDVVTKTTEGLKNTATLFDDKANEKRERYFLLIQIYKRPIRVFYGPDRYFKNYLLLDGEILCVLQLLKKGKFAHSVYLTSIPIEDNSNKKIQNILILLLDSIILLSYKKKKHKWIIETKNIVNIENNKVLKINFQGVIKYFDKKARDVVIEFSNQKQKDYAFVQLQNLMVQKEQEKWFASESGQEVHKNK